MNAKIFSALALSCSALVVARLAVAAETKALAEAKQSVDTLSGEVTTKLYFFDYLDGVGADKTSFLERYRVQRGWSGDTRSGLYMDLDLKVKYRPDDKQTLTISRWGEGQYRHGGQARWDREEIQFTADYNFFRRATGGIDYLFAPNQVPGATDPSYYPPGSTNTNSGYGARFNDDSNRSIYHVDRFAYGMGFMIKPGVLGAKTTIALTYSGYLRYGERLQTYALGGSDVQKAPIAPTTDYVLQRWRGYLQRIDENMNRLGWSITASPKDLFTLAYAGAIEVFDNRAKNYTHRDIPLASPYFYNPTADQTRPVGFIPDSTLGTHALRLGKSLGGTNISTGYSTSKLGQDSFTQPQIRLGYTTGQVRTENAFFEFDSTVTPALGLQGYVRSGQRDNESSYPVAGLISGAANSSQTLGVRINEIESLGYGLAAVLRPKGAGSAVTLGWRAEDKSRDLTYHATEIIPSISLYRTDTDMDEVYAKLSSLNVKGVALRLTASYAWANQTGLVTEPSQAFGAKAAVSYAARNGGLFSAYYSIKDRENDNNTFTDKAVASPATYTQDIASTVQSAGASFNCRLATDANVYAGLDWMRMDASVLFYESSRRRFESSPVLALRDTVGSLVDNYVLSVGGDKKINDRLKLWGCYYLTVADGELASGYVARQLGPIDDTLDSVLHAVEIAASYDLAKNRQLQLSYRYDNYDDSAYPLLSAGVHSLMVGLRFKL